MEDGKYTWIKIANASDEFVFGENNLLRLSVNGRAICLAKTAEGIKAFSNKCPHAGAELSEGKLDHRGNIVCCKHNYHFNLTHGRDALNEGYFLKIYPVEEREDGVYVGMGI